jgi:tRNA (cmo5U34)-methyltransferase
VSKESIAVVTSSDGTGQTSIGHKPGDNWVFDESVTAVFEDMLARSVPQLDVMRDLVFQAGCRFIQPGTEIVDLGCSKGDALGSFIDRFKSTNHFTGLEVSPPMLTACRARFDKFIEAGIVDIRDTDLRTTYPASYASLTLCILTLQFVPIEHRQRLLAKAFARTVPGGAFILVEKVMGGDEQMDSLLVDLYYAQKRSMGYSQEDIDRKRLALEGVLVPVTAAWNEDLLRAAGFKRIECFWRFLNFCGWIATAA